MLFAFHGDNQFTENSGVTLQPTLNLTNLVDGEVIRVTVNLMFFAEGEDASLCFNITPSNSQLVTCITDDSFRTSQSYSSSTDRGNGALATLISLWKVNLPASEGPTTDLSFSLVTNVATQGKGNINNLYIEGDAVSLTGV